MAASTAKPMSRTLPVLSTMTFSGTSRPWQTPSLVAGGDRGGDLGRPARPPGAGPAARRGEHDVERVAGAPLVDDVAEPVGAVGVEHPQQPPVVDGRGAPRRLEQRRRPLVVLGDDVEGDVALEHPVVGTPEPAAPALA